MADDPKFKLNPRRASPPADHDDKIEGGLMQLAFALIGVSAAISIGVLIVWAVVMISGALWAFHALGGGQ